MIATGPHGGELHYLASGTGAPLLFIHGAGGNAAIWWQQFAAFTPDHRVIAYDLPGFGRSPAPRPGEMAELFAGAAAAVLDAEGVKSANVVCQSLGGWSGLRLALTRPDRVSRLVLACTMAGVAHPPGVAAFLAARSKMNARGPVSLGLRETFRMSDPAMSYLYDEISGFNPPLDPALASAAFSPDILLPLEALAAIRCPTLIIAGENDPIWPPASLQGIAAAIPGAQFRIIEGAGHSPYFEQPVQFNAALAKFLQGERYDTLPTPNL